MSFDTVIRNGRWFDGTGAPSAIRNIGVRDGHVAAISAQPLDEAGCPQVIDAEGKWLLPGLVDLHTVPGRRRNIGNILIETSELGLTPPTLIGTLGPDRLTADSAVFDELELRKGIARGMQAVQATALDFGAIRDAVHRAPELTRIDPLTRDPLQAHWTTTRHLETERRVLGELEARSRSGGHGIASRHVEAAIAGAGYVLSAEQSTGQRRKTAGDAGLPGEKHHQSHADCDYPPRPRDGHAVGRQE